MAKFLGSYESNTPEWYALRQGAIGGSDVGAVLGVSPWKSPVALFYMLTGRIPDTFEDNPLMRLGRLLEKGMYDNLVAEHPDWECEYQPGTFAHDVHEFCHSNPDVLVKTPEGKGVVDLKYSASWWSEVPENYVAQLRFYMWIHNLDFGLVAGVIGGRWQEYRVERDMFAEEVLVQQVLKFWDLVQTNTRPDWDGSDSTYQTMRSLYTDIEPSGVELGALGEELRKAMESAKIANEFWNETRSKTLAIMGEAKFGLLNGEKICYRQNSSSGVPFLKVK
jgi:putative phage-type endonuclease